MSSLLQVSALAVAVAMAAPQLVHAAPPGQGGEVPFTRQPGDPEIHRYYPARADRRRQTGRVTIRCRSNSDGELMDCAVEEETPAAAGFGAAARQISKDFRVETGGKGEAWKGRPVEASIDFTPQYYYRVRPQGSDAQATPALSRRISGTFRARYPFQARFTGLSGRVVLHCPIEPGGVASGCAAAEEQPKGLGFGKAAEQGARHIQVAGKTLDGRPTEGMTLEKQVIVSPSCSDLPGWDRRLEGCAREAETGHTGGGTPAG